MLKIYAVMISMVIVSVYPNVMAQTASEPLAITGQLRWRTETRNNADFNGNLDDHTGFILQRIRLNIEKKLANKMRIFIQLQDSRTWGEEGSTIGVLDAIDLHQAYIQIDRIGDRLVTVYLGRQILAYGNQRLVGALDWNNIGRAYNTLRVRVGDDSRYADALFSRIREQDAPNGTPDQTLAGVYSSLSVAAYHRFDVYGLLLHDEADFAPAPGTQTMWVASLGTRIAGVHPSGFDYRAEVVGQFGDRGGLDVAAYGFAGGGGYRLSTTWTPRIGTELVVGSGDDDPTDNKSGTRTNMFGTNHGIYGFIDYAGWSNMVDWQWSISARPSERLEVRADWHLFRLMSAQDNWYRVAGFTSGAAGEVNRFSALTSGKELGQELDLWMRYRYRDRVRIEAGYAHYFAGRFIEQTGGGRADDSDWGYAMIIVDF